MYSVIFFVVMKEGEAHPDAGQHSNTPSSQSLFSSLTIVLCVLLVLGMAYHGMVLCLPLVQRKWARISNHLLFHQKVPHILGVTPVTYFGHEDLGEYNWCKQLI